MIDGLKLEARGDTPRLLLNDPKLDFRSRFISNTAEILEGYQVLGYKGFKVEIRKKKVAFITGSLHKFKYSDNSGNFSPSSISQAVDALSDKLYLDPDETFIRNIEIGFNLLLPFSPTELLRNNVICYKGSPISRIDTFDNTGYQIDFKKSNYVFKLYDKGREVEEKSRKRLQKNLIENTKDLSKEKLNALLEENIHRRSEENILRIEVRVKVMAHIKGKVKVLSDLKDEDKLFKLISVIDDSLKHLLIVDSMDVNKIKDVKDKELFLLGINPTFWERFRPKPKEYQLGEKDKEYVKRKNKYYRIKNEFQSILQRNNLLKTKKFIELLIENKKQELFGYNNEYDGLQKKLFHH